MNNLLRAFRNSLNTKDNQNKFYYEIIQWGSTMSCIFGYIFGVLIPVIHSMNQSKDPVAILAIGGFLMFGALYGCMWLPDFITRKVSKLAKVIPVKQNAQEENLI